MSDWAADKANEVMAKWYGADPDEPGEGPTNAMLLSYLAQALREARADGRAELKSKILLILDEYRSIEGIYNWGAPLRKLREALSEEVNSDG